MSDSGKFWDMEQASLFVCTSCYEQVYWKKIPTKCPQCGAYSMYEPFVFDQIKDWGSPALIEKAGLILCDVIADRLVGDKAAIAP